MLLPPEDSVEADVINATRELLEDAPLEALAVSRILERAQVSRTTFYRYFASKHDVVMIMLDNACVDLAHVMDPWFDRDPAGSARQAVRAGISACAEVWMRNRAVLRACSENWQSDVHLSARWLEMMNGSANDIAVKLDEERAIGVAVHGLDSVALARSLTWGSERIFYLAGLGLFGSGMELDAVDVIVEIWVGVIYGVAGSQSV